MKVAIDARVQPAYSGGIAPAVRSLVSALGELVDGEEEYRIIVASDEQREWLSPLGQNQQFARRPEPSRHPLARPFWPAVRRVQNWLAVPRQHWPEVPLSDGFFEGLGCDLIHFPTQRYTVCALRSVYNPIDLQHVHYPEFFDPVTIAWREKVYRTGCNMAKRVIVNSEWIKEDLVQQYQVDPAKIVIVAEASPVAHSEPSDAAPAEVSRKYGIERPFVLYPAVTWPHKNHLRLFEALAWLRERRGLGLQLVCTGSRYEPFWPSVERGLQQFALTGQVKFLGHIPQDDLRGLYRAARGMVLPSLFEANSLPIFEAWREGTPVACSNVTALPEQVGEAALLFNPSDHVAIANALAALASDEDLRATLRNRGYRRSQQFTWKQTALAYRAVYRSVAGVTLTAEDRRLLEHGRRPREVCTLTE